MGRTGTAPKKGSLGKALVRRQATNRAALAEKANAIDADGSGKRGKLVSVLECSSLDDFIQNAMMSEREFESHAAHTVVLNTDGTEMMSVSGHGMGGFDEAGGDAEDDASDWSQTLPMERNGLGPVFKFEQLHIPRRPQWNRSMTPEEVDKQEKEAFLEWRREIAAAEETKERLKVTPFEKNLEVWRQLWRVMERSDLIVQIVDARSPLFYYQEDLKTYAQNMSPAKPVVMLVNKSDYLSRQQRKRWAEYFLKKGWHFLFFSARASQAALNHEARVARGLAVEGEDGLEEGQQDDYDDDEDDFYVEEDDHDDEEQEVAKENEDEIGRLVTDSLLEGVNSTDAGVNGRGGGNSGGGGGGGDVGGGGSLKPGSAAVEEEVAVSSKDMKRLCKLLSREELTAVLEQLTRRLSSLPELERNHGRVCVGMVGYPNVGKSSVINVLVGATPFTHGGVRVSVGATPGKTKHFQTLVLSDTMMLCDCPGLVFPSFVGSSAEMLCAGVLPIMQMRDPFAATQLIAQRVPRHILELTYTIKLPVPERGLALRPPPPPRSSSSSTAAANGKASGGGDDAYGEGSVGRGLADLPPPTAMELLRSFCVARSYFRGASLGEPDEPRAARELLRDYTDGKLLYVHPPPEGLEDYDKLIEFLRETERTSLKGGKLALKLARRQHKQGIRMENGGAGAREEEEEEVNDEIDDNDDDDEEVQDDTERDEGGIGKENAKGVKGPKAMLTKDEQLRQVIALEENAAAKAAVKAQEESVGSEPTKREQGKKKWGKKSKKMRNPTPYDNDDSELGKEQNNGKSSESYGAKVCSGGKRGKAGRAHAVGQVVHRNILPHHPSYTGPAV